MYELLEDTQAHCVLKILNLETLKAIIKCVLNCNTDIEFVILDILELAAERV